MPLDQKMIDELAKLGVYVVPLNDPAEMHKRLAKILQEEHQLDHNEHQNNREWTK